MLITFYITFFRFSLRISSEFFIFFCITFLKYLHIGRLKINILLCFTCIIINSVRSREKFPFSEEVREKHIGFREIGQGTFVLLKQKSGEFFSESPYKP